jgi:hypothetical protein
MEAFGEMTAGRKVAPAGRFVFAVSGIKKIRGDRLLGHFFATSRAKLREIGERVGLRRLVNLQGCRSR